MQDITKHPGIVFTSEFLFKVPVTRHCDDFKYHAKMIFVLPDQFKSATHF